MFWTLTNIDDCVRLSLVVNYNSIHGNECSSMNLSYPIIESQSQNNQECFFKKQTKCTLIEKKRFKVVNYMNTFVFSSDVWTTGFRNFYGFNFHGKVLQYKGRTTCILG